jgi:hypothetical protein
MELGRLSEGGGSTRDSRREAEVIGPSEQRHLWDSSRSLRDFPMDLHAREPSEPRRLLDSALTKEQWDGLSSLLGEASRFSSHDAFSKSYQAWWGRLEGLVRQVQSTLARSLSDAEWDALNAELYIAWKQTGIMESHLRVSATYVRKQADQPSVGATRDSRPRLSATYVRKQPDQPSVQAVARAALRAQPRSGPHHVGGPADSPSG